MIRINGLAVPPIPPNLAGLDLILAINQRLRQISLASITAPAGLTTVLTVKGSDGLNYTQTFVDGILTETTLP